MLLVGVFFSLFASVVLLRSVSSPFVFLGLLFTQLFCSRSNARSSLNFYQCVLVISVRCWKEVEVPYEKRRGLRRDARVLFFQLLQSREKKRVFFSALFSPNSPMSLSPSSQQEETDKFLQIALWESATSSSIRPA